MARPEPRAESVAGGKYKLIKKIGSGSFGIIYLGTNLDNGEEVAVKVESKRTLHPQLRKESKVCKIMNGVLGYPRVRWFGEDYSWSYLVMDLLGPSLEQLFTFCSRKFTMKTVLMLAEQLLSRVEFLHRKHLIHRDIKPDNFLMGKGHRSGELYMIDFGLAKSFRYSGSLNHIESGMNNDLTGTARYASINAHRGCRQSRRDDMVSVGYMLLYFLSGSLPWQGLRAATRKQKYEKICEMKMSSAVEDMCKDYPVEFSTYLGMSSCLGYMESPSYDYSRSLFRNLFRRLSLTYDYKFDWTILKEKGVNEADISDPNTPVPATRPQIQMQQRQKPRHLPSTYNYRQKQQQQSNLQKEQQQHNQLQHQQGVQCLAIEEFQPRPNQQTLEPVEQTRGTKNSD